MSHVDSLQTRVVYWNRFCCSIESGSALLSVARHSGYYILCSLQQAAGEQRRECRKSWCIANKKHLGSHFKLFVTRTVSAYRGLILSAGHSYNSVIPLIICFTYLYQLLLPFSTDIFMNTPKAFVHLFWIQIQPNQSGQFQFLYSSVAQQWVLTITCKRK